MGHPRQSKTSARMIVVREREVRVMQLRKSGMKTREISDALAAEWQKKAKALRAQGLTEKAIANTLGPERVGWRSIAKMVRKMLDQVIEAGNAEAIDLVQMETERLDRLQQAFWAKAIASDPVAFDKVMDIMKRRSKLLGLDAPTKATLKAELDATVEARGKVMIYIPDNGRAPAGETTDKQETKE